MNVRLKGLTKSFAALTVFKPIDLEFKNPGVYAILGPSGCGKSTLLRTLAGLEQPSAGTMDGLSSLKKSFVFQEPRLLPWLSVSENILLPGRLSGANQSDSSSLLKAVDLEKFKDYFPHQLSGGMKMRVSIARALAIDPDVIFFDEPFSALDEFRRLELQELVLSLQKQRSRLIFFVTHSISEAIYLADRVLLMSKIGGQIDLNLEIVPEGSRDQDWRQSQSFAKTVTRITQRFAEIHAQNPAEVML